VARGAARLGQSDFEQRNKPPGLTERFGQTPLSVMLRRKNECAVKRTVLNKGKIRHDEIKT